MDKKNQNLLSVLLLNLFILTIFLFSHQTSFSQPLLDSRFPKDIAQSPLPKLLDFGAGTCIPCKAMAPILKGLAEEYKGRVDIKIIEVYQEREMTQANRVRLIPTQVFYDTKNQEVFRHEGFMDKEQIKKVFDKMGVK
jgi:thioredoxin-like negative regulator of GroEL